ncbi:uncharacterized protein LOC143445014 [Clavelina lepadiformis]|uniref:uncharacterized protein LOC143445014 n=1 Tax=Clavelina lepadiformis TaxID=159417 RepID=UPI004043649D
MLFKYQLYPVTSNDEGAYALVLSHPLPPYNYSIVFNIAVINAQQLDVPTIVGGSVAAVIVVCITIVVSVYIVKRKPKQNPKSSFNSIEKQANIVAQECFEIKDQNRENLQFQETNGAYESIDRPLEETVIWQSTLVRNKTRLHNMKTPHIGKTMKP